MVHLHSPAVQAVQREMLTLLFVLSNAAFERASIVFWMLVKGIIPMVLTLRYGRKQLQPICKVGTITR